MEKSRQELVEKMLREIFLAFRAIKPVHNDKDHHGFGFFRHNIGHGHRELFFRLMQEKNGISVKEIAEALKITPGAVTQMVDKAVEMEVVTRTEDPNDRRSQIIKLSEKARHKVQKIKAEMVDRMEPKLLSLSDEELSQLTSLLGKINKSESKDTVQ